jgi:cytoskeletal protein RodZ
MRKIIYLFIFAVVLLVLKAFVLDEYIARYYNKDANTTAEANATVEAVQNTPEPEPQTIEPDANGSEADSEKNISYDKSKPPLEQLGDEFSKHIKL